jgi:uncharacterized protein with PIN domain
MSHEDKTGERVVFISLEHPNQDVVVAGTEYEIQSNGYRRALLPRSVKFQNGRIVLDSVRDKQAIESLRNHRDYGIHIKELDEAKLKKKVEVNKINIEMVVCPYCKEPFENAQDMNVHKRNCKIRKKTEVMRSDEPESNNSTGAKGGPIARKG